MIASSQSTNLFDAFVGLKGLPYLAAFRSADVYTYQAKDMVNTTIPYLKVGCTLRYVWDAIKNVTLFSQIPLVDATNHLVGEVSLGNIKNYINLYFDIEKSSMSGAAKNHISDELQNNSIEAIEMTTETKEEIDKFWSNVIDFSSPILRVNNAPFSIGDLTSLTKVHFLFVMLGSTQVYVTKSGKFVGVITNEFFSKGSR